MTKDREQYTMGYGPAATMLMSMRSAQSHAAFFLPHLKAGMNVLDCGCGPGTVTVGFAVLVAPGLVVGTDIEESQVALAAENAFRRNLANVRFEVADIYELPFEAASFDAVFTSAVLGNLREPDKGLREIHRVLKPEGVVGVKEFDHGGDIAYPPEPAMAQYEEFYRRLRREYGHDPEGGRKIGALLFDAGFRDVRMSASYESLSGAETLRDAARVFIGLLTEGWSEAFQSRGWATAEDIETMKEAWLRFAEFPGALFASTWCDAVAFKA
jgi:ubiquinone/menaquinone biosynthesis C-methylase UbiE